MDRVKKYMLSNGSDNVYNLEALKDVSSWYKYHGTIDHEDFETWFSDGISCGFITEV